MQTNNRIAPIQAKERFVILDALRGFALLGICLANFPEFSLYTFQPAEVTAAMPSAAIDRVVRFVQYLFIDGKFYTIFSILFGIGFSIIIANAERKGANGFKIFYRRMSVLALIGFLHLMLLWSGDILLLYAIAGMLLPLFRRLSDRMLLSVSALFIFVPVLIEWGTGMAQISLSAWASDLQWHYCAKYGITEENFGVWLRDARSYAGVFQFLIQGAFERMWKFLEGHRLLKVMGLFLLGFYIGRNRIYAGLACHRKEIGRTGTISLLVGLPLSVVYAWDSVSGHPFGDTVASLLYAVSVVPMGISYMAGMAWLFMKYETSGMWRYIAAPGRMALTNYIGQSLIGILLFYGIGFGWGASVGLGTTELIACGVFVVELLCSLAWLRYFRYGSLEWIWRMLTYGEYLKIKKEIWLFVGRILFTIAITPDKKKGGVSK